jgi:branched-chain amino acid transport system ATP-binding protein
MLDLTGINTYYGDSHILQGVELHIPAGCAVGLLGRNGMGKTTLINMLSGEIPASEGVLKFDGMDATAWPQPRRSRAGIGRSYQRTTIFPQFSVLENCRLTAQAALQRPWHLWQSARDCEHSVGIAREVLEVAGLAAFADRPAGSMSHGQKRQLEIAMCLATRPRVLLLDEPLAGMGAEESERMLSLLERLKRDHAVLLVEHDMDAVFRVADRITVMVNGEVMASDIPDSIRTNPDVQAAYLGDAHEH